MSRKSLKKAVGYLRTSSATNVGPEKDSDKRQKAAIEAYAKAAGYEVVEYFYDVTKGDNSFQDRPQFQAMMKFVGDNGIDTIIVESANRFARDLIIQETLFMMLKDSGITLIASDKPDAFLEDGPTAKLIRQVLGAVSEFEKASIVLKLKAARDRKTKELGHRCEGIKPLRLRDPKLYAEVKYLHRYPHNGRRRSLRQISAELAAKGFFDRKGKPFSAQSIKSMLER